MPVPVFCYFLLQKSYTGNIPEIGRDKDRSSYFYRVETEDREGDEVEHQGGHTMPRRGLALARTWGRCGPPGRPTMSPFRPYILRIANTLNHLASVHEKFCHAATITDEIRGTEVSVLAPCRDGELPRSHLHRLHRHLHRRC